MTDVRDIMEKIKSNIKNGSTYTAILSESERLQREVDYFNKQPGDLNGYKGCIYDCETCKNKGEIAVIQYCDFYKSDVFAIAICKCMTIRESMHRIKKSGLAGLIDKCTFENFNVTDDWQRKAKLTAQTFAANVPQSQSAWLYIGGQVGSGKTHLCAAVTSKYLHEGKSARYMLWRDDSVELKAVVNDDEEYEKLIKPLKTVDVLYIDDLFKAGKDFKTVKTGQYERPTAADIKLAFEILNYRYNNPHLVTIISSELSIADILDFDEAIGSRIYERSKGYRVEIGHDQIRNYRLNIA